MVNRSEDTVTIRSLDTVIQLTTNPTQFCVYNGVRLSIIKYHPISSTLTDTFRNWLS